jgi:hypothetical protein
MSTDHEIAALRQRLKEASQRAPGRQFKGTPKEEAAQLALQRQTEGHSLAATARWLGVKAFLVRAWVRKVSRKTFVPVRVRTEKQATVATQPPKQRQRQSLPQPSQRSDPTLLVTHPASGVRIEGLSIEQLAALLRGLR